VESVSKYPKVQLEYVLGFPYFYVDFATQFGYAHVIEEEKYFTGSFAPEILATVLGVDKNKVVAP